MNAFARSPISGGGSPPGDPVRSVDVAITGVVQGVGFRPFVHRVAQRHGLTGWVRNEAGAVRIRFEGAPEAIDAALRQIPSTLPPLSRVDTLEVGETPPEGLDAFRVVASDVVSDGRLPVSPDVATCPACEAELFDPGDRRHRYPFITCTDCGPRFTVIEAMPYDRERTSMGRFTQCPACAAEYADPADRRYHSETNSCALCGPRLWLEGPDAPESAADTVQAEAGREADSVAATTATGRRAVEVAAADLRAGRIVALRGLGGFHLAVCADDPMAVARLRDRKRRDAKPLAVMVRDLAAVRRLAHLSDAEAELLRGRERPIVVLRRRADAAVAPEVSPGLDSVAVMLPYTPLHLLLLEEVGGVPLVMTSGNVSDEPIAISNEDGRRRLAAIADRMLLHDREIVARYDDSVLRVPDTSGFEAADPNGRGGARAAPIFLRRSRGYAPMPLPIPAAVDDGILAVGPHLKNTFTLATGGDAFVSPHIGDLENVETLQAFHEALSRFRTLFRIDPRWVVRDLHPGYLSTRIAEESGLPELPAVQHHHAHIAAVMGEHGVTEPVLGLAFDGTGYGTDGKVWGCEFLRADLTSFERLGHLRYAPLPGGDRAARAPWRTLLGYASLDPDGGLERDPCGSARWRVPSNTLSLPEWVLPALEAVPPVERSLAVRQVERALNAPLASSLGRLFDAAAALIGVRAESSYEGQAAMELESLAGRTEGAVLDFPWSRCADGRVVLDPLPLLMQLARARAAGREPVRLAADFHATVVDVVVRLALQLCADTSVETVALGGGCFQNMRLLSGVHRGLEEGGLRVLRPVLLSPNDGGVSYGQAVVTAARLSR